MSKNISLSIVLFAYSLCFITFFFVLKKINYGIFYVILIVDVIATVIIYFFSFYFKDFSPGVITGILLYLPVNFLIVQAALKEGFLKSYAEYGLIAFLGTITFVLFEIYGPIIIALAIVLSFLYFFVSNRFTKY